MSVKKIVEETGNTESRTYAEVIRAGRNPTRRQVKPAMPTTTTSKTYMKNCVQ